MRTYKKILLVIILTIISCKENRTKTSQIQKVDSLANPLKKELKTTSPKIVDTICNTDYLICKKFKDNEGAKHVVVIQKMVDSEIYDNIEEETFKYKSTQLFVNIFLNNTKYVKVFDEETNCQGNSEVSFIENSLEITDLNNNGIKEVTFLYDLVCRENMSPSGMKLIMIEGTKKYKIRGGKKFFTDNDGSLFNENLAFNIDESFKSAPRKFLDFAAKQWNKNLYDTHLGELTDKKKEVMKNTQKLILKEKDEYYQ